VMNKPIKSLQDFNDALNLGVMKKTHASTQLNNYSSRSHTIFKLIIRWAQNNFYDSEDENEYEEATLAIVDLAGSERAYRAETSGRELQQACKINHSLYVLGKCMEIMKYNSFYTNKKIVPFRESKLTMLFQEYFQGDQNIIMITNINPGREDFDETLRVLSYACIAKEIRPIKSKILTTNNNRYVIFLNHYRKKEKNSVYDSCSSEDEEKKINNKLIPNSNKYESSTSTNINNIFNTGNQNPFRESYRTLNISGFHGHNSVNHNQNSAFADDIEMLKYEFMNMSRKYENQLEKYEELERKNEFLLSKYKELQFQFKLRELDMRTHMIESISNQLINNKFETFLKEVRSSIKKEENKSGLILTNPFHIDHDPVKKFNEQSNKKDANMNLANSSKKENENKIVTEELESKMIKLNKKKSGSILVEEKDHDNVKNDIIKDSFMKKEFNDANKEEDKVIINQIQMEEKEKEIMETKNSFKPKTKKKKGKSHDSIKKEDDTQIQSEKEKDEKSYTAPYEEEKNENKSKSSKYTSKEKNSSSTLLAYKNSITSKKQEESISSKNNQKKSLKQKEKEKEKSLKSLIEEEDTIINSDEEITVAMSNESSPVKTKNKKNNKKPTKSKKVNKKLNKTSSDIESDLDYSIDSVNTKHKSLKNKKSTDYEDEIEEEKSDSYEEEKESFREVKKKNKKSKKTKKTKKIK
jgi:hypothetical protein